ncbi:MAG: DUF3105 domain-containing protein [Chloroflexi bacterium]|nr:DUF3105 domain-containing protein [Chloroflexota bacterium]
MSLLLASLTLVACGAAGTAPAAVAGPTEEPPALRYGVRPGEVVGRKTDQYEARHVADGVRVPYPSLPPTSGPHWAVPVQWSTYDTFQPWERTVHNLEHGGIVIVHNGLTPTETLRLRDLVFSLPSSNLRKIVLMPFPGLQGARVVLTAWAWESRLQGPDEEAIVKFVKAHYDGPDAPEPGVP